MDRKRLMRWIGGGALVGSLLTGGVVMQGAFAQTPTPSAPSATETKPAQPDAQAPGRGGHLLGGGPRGERGGPGGRIDLAQATASVTGLTLEQVRTELAAGKTFAAIAEANGKTANDVVVAAIKQLETDLAQAVADGTLTQAEADTRLTEAKTRLATAVTQTAPAGPLGGKGGFGGRGGPGGHIQIDQAVASVTGLTEEQVRTELTAGKTPAQIAEANGKTADDVVAAAVKLLQADLDQAVADGRLTQAEADARLTEAKTRLATAVTQAVPAGPLGGGFGGGRHGGPGGFGGRMDLVGATAEVTGLTLEQVRTELAAGKSLAQVAEANGKTSDDILAALRTKGEAQLTEFLDRAKQELSTPGSR